MSKTFTIKDVLNSSCAPLNRHLEEIEQSGAFSRIGKYGNLKTVSDGIVFHSKKEAGYYKKLQLLLKAGEIGFLEMQVPYELNEGGSHSLKYIADFRYIDKAGIVHVVDVKGFKTREYKKKKRLMKKIHGIIVEEV